MIANSVEETINAGKHFADKLKSNSTVLMYGEMGAGKTHFVKGIAKGLGITDNITSPTFALVNSYNNLHHFDLFRIQSEEDLYAIGFYDYSGIVIVEWAENVPELEGDFTVRIEKIDENTRKISF
jgi:tRNA threonylcarbamoyladenosine biosynthesis protein TsaE